MTNVYERPEDAAKRFAQRVLVLESRIQELETELAEHDDYYRKVVNDKCAPDELHCTCVPALRDKIDSLEAALARLKRDGCYSFPRVRSFTDARNPRIPFP